MTRVVLKPTITCQHCGASGLGGLGCWTDTCPECEVSPERRAWYADLHQIGVDMKAAAYQREYGRGRVALTPEIRERLNALGPYPPS